MSQNATVELHPPLTCLEAEAARAYGAEATFFHASAQGWAEHLAHLPAYSEFVKTAQAHSQSLDCAISRSLLKTPHIFYSGHGRGLVARGSLYGDSESFIGLKYCYNGYISTTTSKEVALYSFLNKTEGADSRPTLLKFDLPSGYPILDMNIAGIQGEFEFLIGRGQRFEITGASYFSNAAAHDAILCLHLTPS